MWGYWLSYLSNGIRIRKELMDSLYLFPYIFMYRCVKIKLILCLLLYREGIREA
jgi:hypothetical protein